MKKEYNFSKGTRGKFYRQRKVQKTIRLDRDILDYYQKMAQKNDIPYQTLIASLLHKYVSGRLVERAA